jgi:hypothetical protein
MEKQPLAIKQCGFDSFQDHSLKLCIQESPALRLHKSKVMLLFLPLSKCSNGAEGARHGVPWFEKDVRPLVSVRT